jgi:hypothetical protein
MVHPQHEGICECLKNMFLVLSTQGMFHEPSTSSVESTRGDEAKEGALASNNLWAITWDKLSTSVPHLRTELFPETSAIAAPVSGGASAASKTDAAAPSKKDVEKEEKPTDKVDKDEMTGGAPVESLKEES